MLSIAVLSNQEELGRIAAGVLGNADYRLALLSHGREAMEQLEQHPPDLLVFDHGDGSHVGEWRQLAQIDSFSEHTALLVVIRPEQALLLEEQPLAHDFALWPLGAIELLLRVRWLLRRRVNVNAENVLRCGELVLDLANYKVTLAGHAVELTFKEYELLRFLASNPNKVYTREALLNRVWGYDYYGGARTVDVHIRRLRSKIELHGHSFIETIRNVGYRFHEG